jgi:hypothetical protein
VRTLKIPAARDAVRPPGPDATIFAGYQNELFDLQSDPGQNHPIQDELLRARMEQGIVDDLRRHDAPPEVFRHYRLPNRDAQSRTIKRRKA